MFACSVRNDEFICGTRIILNTAGNTISTSGTCTISPVMIAIANHPRLSVIALRADPAGVAAGDKQRHAEPWPVATPTFPMHSF